jgi:DNA-binding transcriptional regulator YdaS (Cro superfamily)
MQKGIAEASQAAGGQARLALLLGLKPPTINQWIKGIRPVPDEHCPAIERATDGAVTCEAMRPNSPWRRIPDKSWPHPKGRPVLDFAATTQAAATLPELTEAKEGA